MTLTDHVDDHCDLSDKTSLSDMTSKNDRP